MSSRSWIGTIRGNNASADHLHSGQDAANSDTDAQDFPSPEDFSNRASHFHSYPGWFGLPYQDHNYGAPPPLSPSPLLPKSPTPPPPTVNGAEEVEEEAKVPAVSYEEEVVEDSITRCICGFLHDDGYMICCDKCSVWQHIDCMEIDRNNIPESYCCEQCEPRELDVERARMIQLRRKEEIDTSATDTDPEEPANALASLGRKPVQPKPKGNKQRRVSKSGARLLKTAKLAKSQQLKRDKKLKLTKKEKENMKDALKKQKIKKKLNTSLSQNKADFLNFFNEPFCSVYGILENEYSPEVLEFLSHVKTNGAHSPHSIGVFPEELLVRLYKVSEIKKDIKGLEATQLIIPGKAVIEFRGRVMLQQHYLPEPHLDQSQPYVLYYSKFEGLDLCIDASAFGGDARFIRRSCTPNAETCHIIDHGKLQFIVQAKKEIPKGTEITIPFDFNYQESPTYVECACGRSGCPVAKFWKKVKLAQKSPDKPKRKRQASGEGRVQRNSQGKNSPVKVSPCGNKSPVKVNSPSKNFAGVPPFLSLNETSDTLDITASGDNEFDFPSLVKRVAAARRSSRVTADQKEESDKSTLPSSLHRDSAGKGTATQDSLLDIESQHCSATESTIHHTSETEAESAGDSHRKLTREERKMEAIMKAFEKLEKREERRKEALARLDKKHIDLVKEDPVDRCNQGHEPCGGNSAEPIVDSVADQTSQSSVNSTQSPETDRKTVVKQEDHIQDGSESLAKSASRHKRLKRKRRNSRVMSALEPLYTSPPPPQLAPSAETLPDPSVEDIKEESVDLPAVPSINIPTNFPPVDQLSPMAEETPAYMFNKKRKLYMKWMAYDHFQYLFNDLSGSRSPEGPVRDEEMFVSCTPGPRSSLENMQRRYSTSTCGRTCDSNRGNAKKRWLRQAMYETVPLRVDTDPVSPRSLSTDSCSPPVGSSYVITPGPSATVTCLTASTPILHSPNGSPSDFVTPLKKRRLAPEFLPSTSSAVHVTSPVSEDSAPSMTSPVIAESTSTSSTIPSALNEIVPSDKRRSVLLHEKRPRMKGTCLFGRKKGNGLLVPTRTHSLSCESPVPENSDSSAVNGAGSELHLVLDHLSYVGIVLNHSCSKETGGLVSTGSMPSCTVRNIADSAEASGECRFDSPAATASSSSAVCVIRHLEPGVEVPLVDSSDTALDTGQVSVSPPRTISSDSVGVCSSDNEVSPMCVNSADSDGQEEGHFRKDEVVAESSSVASSGRSYPPQDQDEDVSESQPLADRPEVEDEGNEASGSVSVSDELSRQTEQINCTVPQSASECQVNSSQDFPACRLLTSGVCSPGQGEAECRQSSQSLDVSERTRVAVAENRNNLERIRVTSAVDHSSVDMEINRVMNIVKMLCELENFVSSDAECGPSSSTQALHSQPLETVEPMVCNSSDVTGSSAISFVCEDSNVDSTTQSGCVVRVDLNLCDTVDSQLQAAESEESCCDSNSDEQTENNVVREGGIESSSGPADSQGDEGMYSGAGGVSTSSSVVVCSTASVSSSHYSTPQTDVALGTLVSSSVYSSVQGESAVPNPQVGNPASSSALSIIDYSDLPGPSQSTSQNSLTVPSPEHHSASQSSQELDDVDTSEQQYNGLFMAEQCEASTSTTVHLTSEDGDASRPESSSVLQSQNDGDLSMSSGGLDTPEDRVVLNGFRVRGVSFVSEDSSSSNGPNPAATVSSSEAQAAPAAKRKVSLSEYRSRRKDKSGCTASTSSATSPKSSSDHHTASCRDCADYNCITLSTLPLFEPISLRESRDHKEKEKREKPMSLSDRLRIEFGLETSEDEDKDSSNSGPVQTTDIPPPPPPLPSSGKVGRVVGKRPGCVRGAQVLSTENEEDSPLCSSAVATSSMSPSATVTTVETGRYSSSMTVAACNTLSSWLSKMPTPGHPPSSPSPLHQLPASAPVSSAGTVSQQLTPQSYNVAGSGGSHVPNGSHPPVPSAFYTAALFAATTSQGPPSAQSFPAPGKQHQTHVPPPPPSTAYPQYLAQSRTHCVRAQTLVSGRHVDHLGSSVSLPPVQQSPTSAAPIGNGLPSSRHAHLPNSSANHSHGRFSFNPFSNSESFSHKSSYAMDRKRQ